MIGAILGNGWFSCSTHEVWHFDKAPWRNYNRLYLELYAGERKILQTDDSWKCAEGPLLFNQLRTGEVFDARKIIPGWDSPGFDDSGWTQARLAALPPGLLMKDDTPKCRIQEILSPVKSWKSPDGADIYDFGKNLTGWLRIKVSGSEGAKLTILYSELLAENGDVDRSNIDRYVIQGDIAQKDVYIHGGESPFVWQPRFAYHGFRYAKIITEGEAQAEVEACYIHSDFATAGTMNVEQPIVAKLLECMRNRYLGNFTGIPTDCPHREKNGWLGDASIGCEPGLWMYDAAKNYEHFMQIIADAQRPTGQISGIAPAAGWGYNVYCGPVEDIALFEIPGQVWQFTGDFSIVEKFYQNMKRSVEYNYTRSHDGILKFGLGGDWYMSDPSKSSPPELTSTAVFNRHLQWFYQFARQIDPADAEWCAQIQEELKEGFLRHFRNSDGTYVSNGMTATATAIYYGFDDSPALVEHLRDLARKANYKAEFGCNGAKVVPRVLAESGHADEAFRMFAQTEFPGWGNWILRGATTLWEAWDGRDSQTHVMHGDITAWCYRYLAGFRIAEPGFKKMILAPQDVPEAGNFSFTHLTPFGEIKAEKIGDLYRYHIPEEIGLTVELPPHWTAERF